jgi:hypothetical protein
MVVHQVSFALPAHECRIAGRFSGFARPKSSGALLSTEAVAVGRLFLNVTPHATMKMFKSVLETTIMAFDVLVASGQRLVVSVPHANTSCKASSRHAASSP